MKTGPAALALALLLVNHVTVAEDANADCDMPVEGVSLGTTADEVIATWSASGYALLSDSRDSPRPKDHDSLIFRTPDQAPNDKLIVGLNWVSERDFQGETISSTYAKPNDPEGAEAFNTLLETIITGYCAAQLETLRAAVGQAPASRSQRSSDRSSSPYRGTLGYCENALAGNFVMTAEGTPMFPGSGLSSTSENGCIVTYNNSQMRGYSHVFVITTQLPAP